MTKSEAIAELVRIWHSPHLDLSLKAGLAEAIDALKGADGDLISRQDAIDAIENTDAEITAEEWDELTNAIKLLPSAEPKTGKWELDPNGMDWNIPAWRCSECGFVANYIGVEANGLGNNPMNWAGSKFCPQCGVRITGYER